jgi:hypothetical protein
VTQLRAEPVLREGGGGEEVGDDRESTCERVSECAGIDGQSASAQNRVCDEE